MERFGCGTTLYTIMLQLSHNEAYSLDEHVCNEEHMHLKIKWMQPDGFAPKQ